MSKRNIIFICVAVAAIIVIAFAVYFITKMLNKSNNSAENINKITLIKYDNNLDVEKSIELTNKKQISELKKIFDNLSLEQDDNIASYAIKKDVEINLGNGKLITIQLDLPECCYYEDTNTETKLIIRMPEGLLEKVNAILEKN